MDPNDLLKAAPEVQKIVATIVAGVPIAEIVKAIVLPSAEALGKRMANRVERLFEKTGKMVQAAGSPVQEVPEKILIPILQGVALEDDEDLHTMWAALLANAASPENAGQVRPGFIAVLKQMAPDEAVLLQWLSDMLKDESNGSLRQADAYPELQERITIDQLGPCFDGLEAEQLVRAERAASRGSRSGLMGRSFSVTLGDHSARYSVTDRGIHFLIACRPPKPKENG